MASSYFFYDLETSGLDVRGDRIMQFAGIRTNAELEQVGEPYNLMLRMSPDTVPSPDAVLITGITPQATLADGLTEAEFLKLFYEEIVTPDTCFLGYNTLRFDDEFMRFLHYRNFYDPYEWHWANGCSRWDLLDVVRMTRALRPAGIKWPVTEDGKPTNRLELLTKENGIDHYAAHDALSDVHATIAVAKLIRNQQRKLFDYLFDVRGKKKVEELVGAGQPFIYSAGSYASEYEKTTVAVQVADHHGRGAYVYDLRHDPSQFAGLGGQELARRLEYTRDLEAPTRLPVKMMQYNQCPAVAPLGVLDAASQERLQLNLETVQKHLLALRADKTLLADIAEAVELRESERDRAVAAKTSDDVDGQLYDGFIGNDDKIAMRSIRVARPEELSNFAKNFRDERLKRMVPRYKARNYPESLSDEERREWEAFCRQRLFDGGQQSRLAQYFARLQELAATASGDQAYLLEELQLYGQSVMPAYEDDDAAQ